MRKDSLCTLARRFCVSRKGGTGGGGWGHPQGAMHMAVARLGCKKTMVGTGWAYSRQNAAAMHACALNRSDQRIHEASTKLASPTK